MSSRLCRSTGLTVTFKKMPFGGAHGDLKKSKKFKCTVLLSSRLGSRGTIP